MLEDYYYIGLILPSKYFDLFLGPEWESQTQPLSDRFNNQIDIAVDYHGQIIPQYGSGDISSQDTVQGQMDSMGMYNGLLMKFYHPSDIQELQDYIREKYDPDLPVRIQHFKFDDQYYDQEQDKIVDITVPFVIIDFDIQPETLNQ